MGKSNGKTKDAGKRSKFRLTMKNFKMNMKKYSFYSIAAWIVVPLGLVYGVLCLWSPDCLLKICPNANNTETIRIMLLVVGAGLVLLNLGFANKRIKRADAQIKRADAQIAESQAANFLSAFNNGINMLYSDDARQIFGVGYLHKLAETHKEKPERIQQVFDALRVLYANTINKL